MKLFNVRCQLSPQLTCSRHRKTQPQRHIAVSALDCCAAELSVAVYWLVCGEMYTLRDVKEQWMGGWSSLLISPGTLVSPSQCMSGLSSSRLGVRQPSAVKTMHRRGTEWGGGTPCVDKRRWSVSWPGCNQRRRGWLNRNWPDLVARIKTTT